MFYSLEREKDTTPSRDVSTKREKRGSAMLETRSRMKRRQEINRAVWISRNVVCNNSTASFFFFFYRKFDEKEISTLWILWVFLVEEVNIKKKRKEEEKKNKKKIHKERAAVFRIVKRISVIETRNVWCCCVEEGQRVLYAKTEILFRTNKLQRVFTRDFFPADKIFTKKNERVFELMID